MNLESLLQGLNQDIRPTPDLKARIRERVTARIRQESPLFAAMREDVHPNRKLQKDIWKRIAPNVSAQSAAALADLRDELTPSEALRLAILDRVFPRLHPQLRISLRSFRPLKWAAAFVLCAFFVRVSPMLFLASPTVAETPVELVATRGDVYVSIGGLWQQVRDQIALKPGMKLRTGDGEASIILHDDGVVRMDGNTVVELQDIASRVEPSSDIFPTLTVNSGRIWLQAVIPGRLRGITVSTAHGQVTVNEGSVSVTEGATADVQVFDREAVVTRSGTDTILTTGERTVLQENGPLLVKKIPEKWFQQQWADQNLERDSVHRKEIAELQHERRIAQAGILPTSPLYAVKRLAEKVDVLLTFDGQTRVQKELAQAETRLNEASALLHDGEQPDVALDEYTATLQRLAASASTDGSLAQFLVQRALAETSATVAAVLPGDQSYVIKKTVLEASAGLSDQTAADTDVRGELLLDNLTVMMQSMEKGDLTAVSKLWQDLQPYLAVLDAKDVTLSPSIRKEAKTLLAFLATSLEEAHQSGIAVDPGVLKSITAYLPVESAVASLSDEEITDIVQRIRNNIFAYNMTKSRIDQFVAEMRTLQNSPDQGRILRRLAQVLPDGPEAFPAKVYKEIVRLRWERAGEGVI